MSKNYVANHAVDGKEETCSKTIKTINELPWWQVELDEKTNITFIQLKNSRRHATSLQIYVRYDVGKKGKACGKNFHVLAKNEARIIRCHEPLYGRSIKIVGTRENDSLSLCEVQLFNDSGLFEFFLLFIIIEYLVYCLLVVFVAPVVIVAWCCHILFIICFNRNVNNFCGEIY